MAVAIIVADSWIQHLPFEGGPRQTLSGPVDGVWYGVVSGVGDSGGGNLTLSGQLTFDRKEDWVYILKAANTTVNSAANAEAFVQLNTGPLIPTSSAVVNPTFNFGGSQRGIANNSISIMADAGAETGPMPFPDMPIFGDKRIAGTFLMAAAGFSANIDAATFTLSLWGYLVRYQGFFRNRPPALG